MKIPQDQRREMAARATEIGVQMQRLMDELVRLSAEAQAKAPELVNVTPDVARALLPAMQRRAAAAQELAELTQEAGALTIDHMASENPFKTGGLLGRSQKVKALRAHFDREFAAAQANQKAMSVECGLFEIFAKGDENDESTDQWIYEGLALMGRADQFWQGVLELVKQDRLDMLGIEAVAAPSHQLSEDRIVWMAENRIHLDDPGTGGTWVCLHTAAHGIRVAAELRWACHVLQLKGDDAQRALVPRAISLAEQTHDTCWQTGQDSARYTEVPREDASRWAVTIMEASTSVEMSQPCYDAQKLGGMPEPWCVPGVETQ